MTSKYIENNPLLCDLKENRSFTLKRILYDIACYQEDLNPPYEVSTDCLCNTINCTLCDIANALIQLQLAGLICWERKIYDHSIHWICIKILNYGTFPANEDSFQEKINQYQKHLDEKDLALSQVHAILEENNFPQPEGSRLFTPEQANRFLSLFS